MARLSEPQLQPRSHVRPEFPPGRSRFEYILSDGIGTQMGCHYELPDMDGLSLCEMMVERSIEIWGAETRRITYSSQGTWPDNKSAGKLWIEISPVISLTPTSEMVQPYTYFILRPEILFAEGQLYTREGLSQDHLCPLAIALDRNLKLWNLEKDRVMAIYRLGYSLIILLMPTNERSIVELEYEDPRVLKILRHPDVKRIR